jgi:hypothetical protein
LAQTFAPPRRQYAGFGGAGAASGVADGEGAALPGKEDGAAGDWAGAEWAGTDCAAGAEFEQAVMNAAVPRADTSNAAIWLFRLHGVGRLPAGPSTGSVPGRR